jgi:hypothetical protein
VSRPRIWLIASVNAIIDDPKLSSHEKLVLLVLARHCDGRGVCWPSKRVIVERSGLSRASVMRALTSLERSGKLDRVDRRRERDRNESNLYRVRVPMAGGVGLPQSPSGAQAEPRKDLSRRDLSDRSGLSFRAPISKPPSGGEESEQAAQLAAATRRVGVKLARNEFHRLAQVLATKGLSSGLLVRAAEQFRDAKGPWERSATLRHGVTVISDDPRSWAAELAERRTKTSPMSRAAEKPSRDWHAKALSSDGYAKALALVGRPRPARSR